MVKNVAALCQYPKALWKAEFKSDELGFLAKEISKQQSSKAPAWLLLSIYNKIQEQWCDLKVECIIKMEAE